MPGGHSGEVIPVPIPNTEVKLSYADDTAFWWESRKLPGFFYLIFLSKGAWKFPSTYFFCLFVFQNSRLEQKIAPVERFYRFRCIVFHFLLFEALYGDIFVLSALKLKAQKYDKHKIKVSWKNMVFKFTILQIRNYTFTC